MQMFSLFWEIKDTEEAPAFLTLLVRFDTRGSYTAIQTVCIDA